MKNTLFLLLFCVASVSAQTKFGLSIGVNLSGVSTDAPNTKINLRPSFQIGAMADIRLSEKLFFQGSLLFSERGYGFLAITETVDSSLALPRSSVVTSEGKRILSYIDLPVLLVYKLDLGIGRAFVGAGPYFSYNLRGVNKENNTYVVNSDRDLSITKINGNYDMNRLQEISRIDYGATFTLGIEFEEKWQLAAHYGLGLADIDPNQYKVSNRTTSITLVYLFDK
ncbi:MAG: PorT family protein [Verrucomicrobia bacterium]|nr:PorT family protein [Cytophagales bacterium]